MIGGVAALVGVIVGFLLADHVGRRRDLALFNLTRSQIVNTKAPTTDELQSSMD